MIILIKTLQVILALSILIIVHEFGHFFWAKVFKIRVEKFYLFFDIGGKALARWKWGDTEFGIGWLPFGGYCKISGMVDESMDLKQLKSEVKKWEYRAHPAWQRLLVVTGGVINNIIFAVICFICIMAVWGKSYIANESSQIYVNDLAYEMGFRSGDRILRFDDYSPENFATLQADLVRREAHYATVLRGADTIQLYIDQSMIEQVLSSGLMFDLAVPFIVDSVDASGPNGASVLQKNDRIVAFDSESFDFLQQARPLLENLRNSTTLATVIRSTDTLFVPVNVDSSGRIGVYMSSPEIKEQHYNLISAIPAGIKHSGEAIADYVDDLKLIFKPSTGAYKSVGSFIAIGQVFPETWDWYRFLNILALLSIMLGVINIIPIPGLDGGHMFFTLVEIISGKKPSEKFLIAAQTVGMIIIFALMILALGNDIGRLF